MVVDGLCGKRSGSATMCGHPNSLSHSVYFNQNERKNRIAAQNGVLDKSRAALCLGNSCLLELLEGYLTTMEKEGMLKVGVVGKKNKKLFES